MASGSGVAAGGGSTPLTPGGDAVGAGGSSVSVGKAAVPGLAVVSFVGTSVALLDRVAVATMIHGVWVGSALATLPGPSVAVTTTIHGVCVGKGSVGSGVGAQPAKRQASTLSRAKKPSTRTMS